MEVALNYTRTKCVLTLNVQFKYTGIKLNNAEIRPFLNEITS